MDFVTFPGDDKSLVLSPQEVKMIGLNEPPRIIEILTQLNAQLTSQIAAHLTPLSNLSGTPALHDELKNQTESSKQMLYLYKISHLNDLYASSKFTISANSPVVSEMCILIWYVLMLLRDSYNRINMHGIEWYVNVFVHDLCDVFQLIETSRQRSTFKPIEMSHGYMTIECDIFEIIAIILTQKPIPVRNIQYDFVVNDHERCVRSNSRCAIKKCVVKRLTFVGNKLKNIHIGYDIIDTHLLTIMDIKDAKCCLEKLIHVIGANSFPLRIEF